MGKTFITLIMLTAYLYGVTAYCYVQSSPPDPEDEELFCRYRDLKLRSGSSIRVTAPGCEECRCRGASLQCCGYGVKAGLFAVAGCVHVPIPGSCEINLRKIDDQSLPCFETN